ncbi:hypothetical protein [Noviherbaspirillum pedocola]|uniref:Uncharacterized protein n=1 Tax=Noviherbaspirillum pedocola TaxID=2801341 RepID=A0A934SY54_9BURK|nr:hypothetical protein [Noviherbaspirillum pedocola]MBK4737824.1 hypothetical protein [Noviherbaspirillum pedocola]
MNSKLILSDRFKDLCDIAVRKAVAQADAKSLPRAYAPLSDGATARGQSGTPCRAQVAATERQPSGNTDTAQ